MGGHLRKWNEIGDEVRIRCVVPEVDGCGLLGCRGCKEAS